MKKHSPKLGLTIKEHGFVQDVVRGKSIHKAVLKNYDTTKRNAHAIGGKILERPRVQRAIIDLMDKRGVSDSRLVDRLKYLIFDAKKEVVNPSSGEIVKLDDNQTSVRALDMAMKIKGAYAPERHEHVGVSLNLYQDLSDEELDKRIQLIEAREAHLAGGTGTQTGS